MGRGRKAFTPQRTIDEQKRIASLYDGPVFTGPIVVYIDYYTDCAAIHIEDADHRSPLRGDIDNYVKLTLDALNKVAWQDDRQVVGINATKYGRYEWE